MVAAGIYMLCRINVLMMPEALQVISWVGAATAVYAALCAIVQSDIKKVLAYSTLSQLGYMVAAFGLGSLSDTHAHDGVTHTVVLAAGVGAAMFHLTTHAFFKALMFLGSGSVIHACHHEQDIFQMGGLSRKMPLTFVTFTIGVLAIIGTPFLAGFFSKDAILHLALEKNDAIFGVLVFTAVLTSFYMVRMWKLVFLGERRGEGADARKRKRPVDHAPAGGAGGAVDRRRLRETLSAAYWDVLVHIPEAHGSAHTIVLVTSLAVLLIGAGAALRIYQPSKQDSRSSSGHRDSSVRSVRCRPPSTAPTATTSRRCSSALRC
jgi:NADH-quinone oxidoreductase subunit L